MHLDFFAYPKKWIVGAVDRKVGFCDKTDTSISIQVNERNSLVSIQHKGASNNHCTTGASSAPGHRMGGRGVNRQ